MVLQEWILFTALTSSTYPTTVPKMDQTKEMKIEIAASPRVGVVDLVTKQ